MQCIRQFTGTVGGIDVDQDGTDARRGKLQQQPLDVVGRPDADAVTLAEPATQQAPCQRFHRGLQLCIGESPLLRDRNDRLVIREAPGDAGEVGRDRGTQQRFVTAAMKIAESFCWH